MLHKKKYCETCPLELNNVGVRLTEIDHKYYKIVILRNYFTFW